MTNERPKFYSVVRCICQNIQFAVKKYHVVYLTADIYFATLSGLLLYFFFLLLPLLRLLFIFFF